MDGFEVEWPVAELAPLFALAQHHGIPTRLLDWSRSPLSAAYFAAEKAARWSKQGDVGDRRLEIWAYQHRLTRQWEFWPLGRESIRIVSALGSSNPNLHAQSGLFTVISVRTARRNDPPTLPALDQLMLEKLRRQPVEWREAHREHGPVLRRLTLLMREAPELLRLLAFEGITGQILFPGFDGVARGLDDARYWDVIIPE
jgi:hypothetical protein